MTISQRATAAREALFSRYDKLNELWRKAEAEFAQFHIPRSASYGYEADPYTHWEAMIGMRKINGKWRLCHAIYDYVADNHEPDYEPEWTPIVDCSAEIRVKAAKFVDKLRERLVEDAEKFIPCVDDAIEAMQEKLGVGNDGLAELLAERAKLNGKAR